MSVARYLGLGVLMLAASATALAAPRARPDPVHGVVTQVNDGGTVRFTPAGQPDIVVRLANIDAPEICQPWGPEARDALSHLALNKTATLRPTGRDRQGRTVGVLVIDDINVAQQLVEGGHAWSIRTRNDAGPLVKQERMAKALNRGLHEGGTAIKPSEFRRRNGPCPASAPG